MGLLDSGLSRPRMNKSISGGTSVMASSDEKPIARVLVQARGRAQTWSFWEFFRATFEDPFRLRRHQAPSPPKPRSGRHRQQGRIPDGANRPLSRHGTVTLQSPQESTPFCDEN